MTANRKVRHTDNKTADSHTERPAYEVYEWVIECYRRQNALLRPAKTIAD